MVDFFAIDINMDKATFDWSFGSGDVMSHHIARHSQHGKDKEYGGSQTLMPIY